MPFLAFAQNQSTGFRVIEDGQELHLPETLQSRLLENRDQIQEVLLQWLSADGYLNASIDSIMSNQAFIDRNCRFELEAIQVHYHGEIDSSFTTDTKFPFSDQQLMEVMANLINDLGEEGYAFAKASIRSITPLAAECTVNIGLDIDTGPKVQGADLYFSGAAANSRNYLAKVARYDSKRLITPGYLQLLRSNLNSSGLFNSVAPAQLYMRGDVPVIIFEVKERSLNYFNGLLGYVPDASGNGQIVGDVEFSLWNVITEGNGFDFRYQRLRPETSQLNLGASQDWIGQVPIGVSAGFQLYQNDTTYQSRDFEMEGYYLLESGIKLIGGVGFQNTTSGNNLPMVIEPNGKKRTARLGFEYMKLDRYDVPTNGSSIRLILGIANKDLADDSSTAFSQNVLEFTARNYISIFKKSVIVTSIQGYFLESDKVTIHDLTRFGGANSFRGYAEQQFRAGSLLWGDVEYRFMTDNQSYLFGFGAAGGFQRPRLLTETNNDFRLTKYLFSTGFGLSYQTRIGRLKFTYAISPEESIGNGKVHFGFRTEL